jgi:hypothetical protein
MAVVLSRATLAFKVGGTMNPKRRPNHKLYLEVLRRLTPEQKLLKVFELSAFAKRLFIHGLRKQFPEASPEEFRKILLVRLKKCHNRNY